MFDGIINEDLDVQNKYVDSYTKENHVMVNIIYSAETQGQLVTDDSVKQTLAAGLGREVQMTADAELDGKILEVQNKHTVLCSLERHHQC